MSAPAGAADPESQSQPSRTLGMGPPGEAQQGFPSWDPPAFEGLHLHHRSESTKRETLSLKTQESWTEG